LGLLLVPICVRQETMVRGFPNFFWKDVSIFNICQA
jgi:hypothetical protein